MDARKAAKSSKIKENTEADVVDEAVKKFMPYLQEIQKKLFTLIIVALAFGAIGFFFNQRILTFIMHFFNFQGITIVLTSPYQFFDLAINTAIATGFIAAFPLFIYYLLTFLKPALSPHEFRMLERMVPIAIILFVIGFGFGAWVMQFVINIFSQTTAGFNVSNIWDISHFFSQVLIIGTCLGLIFEMPIVITLLIRLKVITKAAIAKQRRIVYAVIVVIAALLPPTDVISLSILTIVPIILFELALIFNK